MPFSKKKVSQSQVNILILDFYLLDLSNCKQTKQKKIDEEVCPQIEKKVQESSCQLSWNFPKSNTVLISHHMLRTLLHPQNTELKRKYLAFLSWK